MNFYFSLKVIKENKQKKVKCRKTKNFARDKKQKKSNNWNK